MKLDLPGAVFDVDGLFELIGKTGMPGADFVVAVEEFPTGLELERAVGVGNAETVAGQSVDPALHPGVDVALEGGDAWLVELLFIGLALTNLAKVEDVGTGRFAGTVVVFGADVMESRVAVGDLERNTCLDGDNVGDVAAAELFDFDFWSWRHEMIQLAANFGIDDPDDDVGEFALGADFPIFGVTDGAFAATVGLGGKGFVFAAGFALEGDGASDVGVEGEDGEEEGEKKHASIMAEAA